MIVDTSILVAILLREDGFEELVMQVAEEDVCNLSAQATLKHPLFCSTDGATE